MTTSRRNDPQEMIHESCQEMMDHVKLLRDYATTPGNVWLARSELNRIQELAGDIELLLARIKAEAE